MPSTSGILIYTIQMANWRVAKKKDIPLIDITAKSGLEYFAPNYSDVFEYKNGRMSEGQYSEIYIQKMRLSLLDSPHKWKDLLNNTKVALACYCTVGTFCHRHIFSSLLTKYASSQGISPVLMGELIPEAVVIN